MEKNWTNGSVFKNIVLFSLPYLLSYFLQTFYGLTDMFIIGLFGEVADTTSVSIGSQIMHMFTVIIVGLAMGSTVMISRSIGENDKTKAKKYIGNTFSIFLLLSIFLTIILILLIKPIVKVMSTPQEAVEGTSRYILVCFIGIPFITAYNVISSIYRGLGDSKTPMYFIAIACVFNIALDFLFIGHFKLGPLGAALATTISQVISVIIALISILLKTNDIFPKHNDFKIDKSYAKEILKVGLPIAIQDGFIQIAFIVITIIANKRGLNDAAAVGIVEKIIGIVFLVPSTMLSTVSALCAQNFGANKYSRAKKTLLYAILITLIYGIIISIILVIFAKSAVSIFTESNTVAQMGGEYLKSYIWDCIFAGMHFCFSGYFCANKKSLLSFVHNAASIVLARIPLSYLFSTLYPETLLPMGLAAPIGSLLSVIICIIFYIYIQKKSKKLTSNCF